MTDVAVLIVNWNTCALLAECLQSVREAGGDLAVQTVVVDNASADGSADMVRARFPEMTLLALDENLGFVGGNNRAYQSADAGARYVLLLNPDAILRPGALAAMAAWMDAHPDAGACGPLTLNPDGTLQPSWTTFPTVWTEVRGGHDRRFRGQRRAPTLTADAVRGVGEAQRVDWVSGACLMARGEALTHALGGVLFDPDFHMYSEETDLCFRLHQAGCPTFFLPQAEAVHHYGQSSKQAPTRTTKLLYRSKYLFFRKHYGATQAALLKVGVGCTSALKWVAFGALGLLPSPRRSRLVWHRDRQRAVLQTLRRQDAA